VAKRKTKAKAQVQEDVNVFLEEHEDRIVENNAEEVLADRFARYSKYIIQNRALPDVRDGLKPVQRRILYAMYKEGNLYNKPYHKSAKTVGSVIGTLHPHGDTSVYDAMVRMSQGWKIVNPLIDMQGNNGSIDNDSAAAMRYTEARLSHIADYVLGEKDLDKETVPWVPNFSDECLEPTVLPARFPNVLINGINGIASGYATNIPPHNLNEVVNATIYRIQHPDSTLDDLMQFVKGPDFPTGGIAMDAKGIRQALETGKGKVMVRSKLTVEKVKGMQQIIITEIPYEVVKSDLVKKIDELRMDKKLPTIVEVRDESDRKGLRIVIDLKKDADATSVLGYLYKNTDLQANCNYNMTAIVDKAPVVVGLSQVLDAFIKHRREVVVKRTKHDLKAKEERLHILEGLMKAMDYIDEIVKIIRQSKTKSDAKQNLMSRFDFSDKQAEAIVVLRLYRLTNTDINELIAEYNQLKADVEELNLILSSEEHLKEVIIQELEEVNAEFPTPRRTQIEDTVKEIVIDTTSLIPDEPCWVTVSQQGYYKRCSNRSYSASGEYLTGKKDGDKIVAQLDSMTRNNFVFFTNTGKYGLLPVHKLPEMKWKDTGDHLSSFISTDQLDLIVAAVTIPQNSKGNCVIVTKKGIAKRLNAASLSTARVNHLMTAITLDEGDEIVSVLYSESDNDMLYLTSSDALGVAYPVSQISVIGSKGHGVKAMKLNPEAEIVSAVLNAEELVVVSQNHLKKVPESMYAHAKRGAKGNLVAKRGSVVTSVLPPAASLLYLEDDIWNKVDFDNFSLSKSTTPFKPYCNEGAEYTIV
jgi:topoisomerase-4 subunit A